VQAHRVDVAILGRLGHAAREVDRQPSVEEALHRDLVICDDTGIHLLAQPAELLHDLGAGTT
jgi:hypothetical protein